MVQVSLFFLLSFMRDQLTQTPDLSDTSHKKHSWSHQGEDGPDTWQRSYEKCGGKFQSPININQTDTEFDRELKPFVFHNYNHPSMFSDDHALNLTNNGHSASTKVGGDLFIEGGGLPGRFNTAEFHFHWGSNEDRGSEHTIDGRQFPLEMHVVHYAAKYGSLSNALNKPDGLAVLGVYFQISQQDNPSFEPLVRAMQKVTNHGEIHTITNFLLDSIIPKDRGKYFRYKGSLTTPPCYETVIWTLFSEPEKISLRQLRYMRHLIQHDHNEEHTHHGNASSHNFINYMVDNYRPIQPLNGRKVFCSFPLSADNTDAQDAPPPISLSHPGVSRTGNDDNMGLEIAKRPQISVANSETPSGAVKTLSAASSQTGTQTMTGNKGDNHNNDALQVKSGTLSQMTSIDKNSIVSEANTVPKHSHGIQQSADPKAQSQRQVHTVSEQFTVMKLQTAEVIKDPNATGVVNHLYKQATTVPPTHGLPHVLTTKLTEPPIRTTLPPLPTRSTLGAMPSTQTTTHAVQPPLGEQPINIPDPRHRPFILRPTKSPTRIEQTPKRIFHTPNLSYNRPTKILSGQTPPVMIPQTSPSHVYQYQNRQPTWLEQQQLHAIGQMMYRRTRPTTTLEPFVFLQPVHQPIRLSKPTYYHYYNNDNGYRPQRFGVDIGQFGEFRR